MSPEPTNPRNSPFRQRLVRSRKSVPKQNISTLVARHLNALPAKFMQYFFIHIAEGIHFKFHNFILLEAPEISVNTAEVYAKIDDMASLECTYV